MLERIRRCSFRVFSSVFLISTTGSFLAAIDPAVVTTGETRWSLVRVENRGHLLKPVKSNSSIKRPLAPLHGLHSNFIAITLKVEDVGKNDKDSLANQTIVKDDKGRQFRNINYLSALEEDYVTPGVSTFCVEPLCGKYLHAGIPKVFQTIYEIPEDATGLQFVPSDLGVHSASLQTDDAAKIPFNVNIVASPSSGESKAQNIEAGKTSWTLLAAYDRGLILKAQRYAGDLYVEPPLSEDGAKFVEIIVRVENKSLVPQEIRAGGVRLLDSDGREFKPMEEIMISHYRTQKGTYTFPFIPQFGHDSSLNPNVPKDFSIIFKVAAESHVDRLRVVDLGIHEQPATAELHVIVQSRPASKKTG